MATRQPSKPAYHTCDCGETFETTDELLAHARDDHGLPVY